jgi:Ca2+-binding EF-hand superfamily protein
MSDRMLSPDGKFMWTGTEWIPAPPSSEGNQINMQDSVMSGDIVSNTVINNDPAVVTAAVITALQQLGMLGENTPQQSPPTPEIELPQFFQVGDHVEYHSPTNERWLNRCKVVALNDDGTYRVEVPKDSVIETKLAVVIGTSPGTIRPASVPFKQGGRVFVNWRNLGHYYPGKITSENANNTFNIHFDDGDVEYKVEWERIVPLNEESKDVQDYIENESKAERELIEAFQVFDTDRSGAISAREFFSILTEMGDDPISMDEVMEEFVNIFPNRGNGLDFEIDYRSLAKYMIGSDDSESSQIKPEVVIRDALISDGKLRGYAYAHPKFGEGPIKSSAIQAITYDERATARVETKNTIYVVGPTGWNESPEDHPFN